MSCLYQYDIQPGPTDEICALEGHSEIAIILKCGVVSEHDFSLNWHHSKSIPESGNVFNHTTFITNSSTTVINTTTAASVQSAHYSQMSQLTLHGFDDKGDGYYWCSVANSGSNVQVQNPSVILHIVHNVHCKANNEQSCNGDISLYTQSLSRCADQATSIDIVQAQNCSNTITETDKDKNDKPFTFTYDPNPNLKKPTFSQQSSFPITTTLYTTNTLQEKVQLSAPKFQLSMGVIIGASMGGLVLILFIVIGLLLVCVVKMKRKYRTRVNSSLDTPTSPFDDIRMYSSIAKLTNTKEKADDPHRISKLYCESNAAYECPHSGTSPKTENIYEHIN